MHSLAYPPAAAAAHAPMVQRAAAIIAGIALLSCGWFAWREASVPWAVAGIVLSLALFVVLRVAVEVVDLVAETLLPR